MSSLDKLAIRGIRSFDHNDLAVMQFYTPLTVIVGHNGSGKTTIIECLKYATTGDLPPNTKGGAFVHDPSIAGTSEVKAQVKLRFFNSNKEQMIVERRLQVSKKKTGTGGLTMKTLEGTISFVDNEDDKDRKNKKRTTLSTKCAALDEEVPKQLGVSKAILENVIFCHQEESNWPLSEPAALKKKFDDIFEATKYTKALDQIKILRKDQAIDIKVDKEKLSALKTDRDRAIRLRQTIEKLETTIQAKEAEHDALEVQIKKVSDENVKYYHQAAKFQEIINKGETFNTQRKLHEEQLNTLKAVLTELKGVSDYELQKKIENHQIDLDTAYADLATIRQHLGDERDAQDKQEKTRGKAQMAQGNLQAQKERYDENLVTRQKQIQEIATRHSMPGYDHDLSNDEVLEFVERLEASIRKQGALIESIKTEGREKAAERRKVIQEMNYTRNSDDNKKSGVTRRITELKREITDINRKLDSVTTTVADIAQREAALLDERNRKQTIEQSVKEANCTDQIRKMGVEARALEERRDALHGELTSLNLQADVRAKLQLKRTETKRKEDAIMTSIESNRTKFQRMTKSDPTPATMEAEVTAVARTLENDIRAADKSLVDARRELGSVETTVTLTKTKLKELKEAAAAAQKKVVQGLAAAGSECKTVADAIEDVENIVEEERKDGAEVVGIIDFYKLLIRNGTAHKHCVGCNRGVTDKELPNFIAHCNAQIQKAVKKQKDGPEHIKELEDAIKVLKKLLPTEVLHTKLVSDDIPAAEEAAATHAAKLPAAKQRTADASQKKTELEAQSEEAQLLKKAAQEVGRLHRETEEIARDITKLESELKASGSTATSDDIQEELSKLTTQLRAAGTAMEKLRTESHKQSATIQSLQNSIHQNEIDLAKKQQELKGRDALEKRKEAADEEVSKLDTERKELEKKMRDMDAPLRKLELEAQEASRAHAAAESLASRELQEYHKSSETIDATAREIKAYETKGAAADLAKIEQDIRRHDRTIGETKQRVLALQADISKAEKGIADSKEVLRNFKDNQVARKLQKEIQAVDDELVKLDVESAEKAHRTYNVEYTAKRRKQSDLQGQQSKLGGEVSTQKNDLDEKRKELASEYDDIDKKYKDELIKVKTAEVANLDLEKYGKALDSAIMSFHGVKMKEINDTIADLWTKTYQGTDIDKIMIKSEGEGKNGKSYNYRVVMQKDNTEMDMRGRCSAGQKVLASIIIRLALAESFGTNCGILALDEPTTNLDQDNILALASALSDLIRERKGQTNFQLLIITHDEQFLETLGGNGIIDKYWRVSRGDGGQVSTIERQRLS